MLRVRRGDKGPRLNGQQVVLSHEPGDTLVIHQEATPRAHLTILYRDPTPPGGQPCAVAAPLETGIHGTRALGSFFFEIKKDLFPTQS